MAKNKYQDAANRLDGPLLQAKEALRRAQEMLEAEAQHGFGDERLSRLYLVNMESLELALEALTKRE